MRYLRPVFLLLALALVIAFWSVLPIAEWVETFRAWMVGLGYVGVLVFIVAYCIFAIILAPVVLLSITAGLAYGAWGFPLVLFSATLAATTAFIVGRYLGRERVSNWLARDPRLQSFNRAVSDGGWQVVGLLRLSPVVPFGIQNYFFAVTNIKLLPYVLATAIGMIPGIILYVYIGAIGQSIGQGSALQWTLLAVGLVSTVLVAWIVGRRAKRILLETQTHTADSAENETRELSSD